MFSTVVYLEKIKKFKRKKKKETAKGKKQYKKVVIMMYYKRENVQVTGNLGGKFN